MYKQIYYFSKQTSKTFFSETLFWPENKGEDPIFDLIFIEVGLYIFLFI